MVGLIAVIMGGVGFLLEMDHRVNASRSTVSFRHEIARIHAPDLNRELQDRFQWDDEMGELKLQQETARDEALREGSGGSSASVPGSLETWRARSSRLARELKRAEARLAAAKHDLSRVAPNDPLLLYSGFDR